MSPTGCAKHVSAVITTSHSHTHTCLLHAVINVKNVHVKYAYSNLAGCSIDATCQIRVGILYIYKRSQLHTFDEQIIQGGPKLLQYRVIQHKM